MSEDLLSCPFCGGIDLKNMTDDGAAWTQCRTCEATGPTTFKRQEDGADWNTRANPPQGDVSGLVEAARDFQRFVMLRPPEGTPARAAWDELAQALASLTTKETGK